MRSLLNIFVLLFLLLPGLITAQDSDRPQTLVSGPVHHGFYFAPVAKVSRMDGETALLTGGKMAWLINHRFSLGLAGYGRIDDLDLNWDWDWDHDPHFHSKQMGYGGLYLESIFNPMKVLRLSAGLLIGAGAIVFPQDRVCAEQNDSNCYRHYSRNEADVFFAMEPEINIEAGITRYFTLGLGLTYRFVSGINEQLSSNSKMSGPSAALTLKFGRL